MGKQRPQEIAARKLAHARKMMTAKTRAMRRLATSLRFWEGRAAYYAKRASLTDAEIATERLKRLDAAARRQAARIKRGIALKEVS